MGTGGNWKAEFIENFKKIRMEARGSSESLPYNPPEEYLGLPRVPCSIEVIKAGTIIDQLVIPPDRQFSIFGRIPLCHYVLDHPVPQAQ